MEKDARSTGKRQRLYRVRTLRRTLSLWSYFKRKPISDRSGEMHPVPALHRCLSFRRKKTSGTCSGDAKPEASAVKGDPEGK